MNFLLSEKLLKSRETHTHCFFTLSNISVLDWTEVIACLNYNVTTGHHIKILPNFGVVLHNHNNIQIINSILKEYGQLDSNTPCSAHLYISFTEQSETFGRHKDTSDVLFWQCIGSTKWVVEDSGNLFTYILNPNDFIYVPRGMYHTVLPLTPRVGVSFGLDY